MSEDQEQWNPDYPSIIRIRLENFRKIHKDANLQIGARAYYKDNPIEFIEDFAITYDPRKNAPDMKEMPFIMFPLQHKLVNFVLGCIDDQENGIIEKSRDMGATWVCSALSVWIWLYMDGASVGWGSRKEQLVDRLGDPDSIFEKIRMIINNIPRYMLPSGFSERDHMTYMRIINPETGATITGESGKNIGRGGRKTVYFKDEAAHYEQAEMIESALGDNTNVQIDISSVFGTGTVFNRRRNAAEEWHEGKEMPEGRTRLFIMDWRDHPNKTQEWYDKREKRALEEGLIHIFRQEVDRDATASLDRIIIPPAWINAAVDAHKKLKFEHEGKVYAAQDVADGGTDKNALTMRKGVVLFFAEHWHGEADEAAERAYPWLIENKADHLSYDSIGVGAGFKGGLNKIKSQKKKIPFKVDPWNAGGAVQDPDKPSIEGDPESIKNKDQYFNLKAQSWFRLRARFYKTFRAVKHGEKFPSHELISLDSRMENLNAIKTELSQVVQKDNGDGKTTIDKKPNGATSPNLADSIVACYNPIVKLTTFDVM